MNSNDCDDLTAASWLNDGQRAGLTSDLSRFPVGWNIESPRVDRGDRERAPRQRHCPFRQKEHPVRLYGSSSDKVLPTEGLVDLIEEIRLRTWARQNYTEPKNRVSSWPSIVHDEMERRDRELERQAV
jgi:hypothetical protein